VLLYAAVVKEKYSQFLVSGLVGTFLEKDGKQLIFVYVLLRVHIFFVFILLSICEIMLCFFSSFYAHFSTSSSGNSNQCSVSHPQPKQHTNF
jgi:hypothetical protein